METIEHVAEMMVTLEDFSNLLEQESAAIRDVNIVVIKKLAETKQAMAWRYQQELRLLADRRAELAALPPEIKARLREAWEYFDAQLADNALALEVAQYATRHVVGMIVSAVRNAQGASSEGLYKVSGEAHVPMAEECVSVTLNQVI